MQFARACFQPRPKITASPSASASVDDAHLSGHVTCHQKICLCLCRNTACPYCALFICAQTNRFISAGYVPDCHETQRTSWFYPTGADSDYTIATAASGHKLGIPRDPVWVRILSLSTSPSAHCKTQVVDGSAVQLHTIAQSLGFDKHICSRRVAHSHGVLLLVNRVWTIQASSSMSFCGTKSGISVARWMSCSGAQASTTRISAACSRCDNALVPKSDGVGTNLRNIWSPMVLWGSNL